MGVEKDKTTSQLKDLLGHVSKIPLLALQLMLIGILLPTAFYSFNLRNPTPAQLLVAVCMALFSGVVFLWILDATNILLFRSKWVSRSVYGAAIASVLGTSVAVYRDAFDARKYPYEGAWEVNVLKADTNQLLVDHKVVLSFSESAGVYWGYSNVVLEKNDDTTKALWIEVKQFRPDDGYILMRLVSKDGSNQVIDQRLTMSSDKHRFESQNGAYKIQLTRPTT